MSEIVIAKPASLAHIPDNIWQSYTPAKKRETVEREQRIAAQPRKPAPIAPATAPADPKVAALLLRIKTDKEWVEVLKTLWQAHFPDYEVPPSSQFQIWINWFHDYDRVVYGMDEALSWLTEKVDHPHKKKFDEHPNKPNEGSLRQYISGIIKNGRKEKDGRA